MLSDEQMSNGYPFSLLNDEQMSNKVGVEHLPVVFTRDYNPTILPVPTLFRPSGPQPYLDVESFTPGLPCARWQFEEPCGSMASRSSWFLPLEVKGRVFVGRKKLKLFTWSFILLRSRNRKKVRISFFFNSIDEIVFPFHYPKDPCMVYFPTCWIKFMVNASNYTIHGSYGISLFGYI